MMRLVSFLLLTLASVPVAADISLPESKSELIEVWSSVLYCRSIYEEPDIRGRIYDGDRNSCNEANRSMASHTQSNHPEAEARTVFESAQKKAAVIRYNTRSVQEAVTACRELCRSYSD
jgi:hypothetical protein